MPVVVIGVRVVIHKIVSGNKKRFGQIRCLFVNPVILISNACVQHGNYHIRVTRLNVPGSFHVNSIIN